uniref:Glycosyltransferase n=1 Tax=viral metagenome TaxID=1070528 RepID=A0A6M3IPT5_9ZZZZ
MQRLILGNIDYERHMTDEGDQLQRGLQNAGWILAGAGYGDGCRDVPTLLKRHRPDVVLVHDKRDWDPDHRCSFRDDVGYTNLGELASRDDIVRLVVVKDAGSAHDYHIRFIEEVGADAVVTYYHDTSVDHCFPYLRTVHKIRTYHTIDSDVVRKIDLGKQRDRGLVTGAMSERVYPFRHWARRCSGKLGILNVRHPGFSNHGCATGEYLELLSRHKVHVATASIYGFALRKLIESAAVCCIPVTTLPAYDVLPEIDDILIRAPYTSTIRELRGIIDSAEKRWSLERLQDYANRAIRFYDYRAMGQRLSDDISEFATRKKEGACKSTP